MTAPDEPNPSPADDTLEPPTFEEALAALGEVVSRLESGGLGLAASIAAYERGVGLLRRLHDELTQVEARVEMLVQIDDEGRPVLAPAPAAVAPSAEAADSPQTPRARASRGGRARRLPGMDDPSAGP